jgi:hypothetical protein
MAFLHILLRAVGAKPVSRHEDARFAGALLRNRSISSVFS